MIAAFAGTKIILKWSFPPTILEGMPPQHPDGTSVPLFRRIDAERSQMIV
jgi:hypothetical protein